MAANLSGVLIENTRECVKTCKILVVGAGGIGCELLKNLVLTGFNDISVVSVKMCYSCIILRLDPPFSLLGHVDCCSLSPVPIRSVLS